MWYYCTVRLSLQIENMGDKKMENKLFKIVCYWEQGASNGDFTWLVYGTEEQAIRYSSLIKHGQIQLGREVSAMIIRPEYVINLTYMQ